MSGGPGMTPEQQAAMQQAMKDPGFAAKMQAMQEAMKNPEVQQQMAAMQSAMQNQALQKRMEELKNDPDPDMAKMFADIKTGGMEALMKYYNDPKMLSKLSAKLGDVQMPGAPGGGPPPGAPPPPEVTNLLDAAKYNDLEAVEDFISIGKDVNMRDPESRTPLHFAAAHDAPDVASALLEAGAQLEAQDSKQNTPLHYAAGYGRERLVQVLLDAGASTAARNHTGKTAVELVRAAPPNPLNKATELLKRLSQ